MKNAVCHDVHGLRAAGATIEEIARLTGLSRYAVEYRLDRLPRRKESARRCLCCGKKFMSSGPANRLCSRCLAQSVTELELWGAC